MSSQHLRMPSPIPLAAAERQGLVVLGTCDWGGCDREAWGLRWDPASGQYVTVCHPCSRTGARGLAADSSDQEPVDLLARLEASLKRAAPKENGL